MSGDESGRTHYADAEALAYIAKLERESADRLTAYTAVRDLYEQTERENERLREALTQIADEETRYRFFRDPLEHARSVVEEMRQIAGAALEEVET